jgi:Fur family transcriptional regulator, ferric uptake regulator
MKSTKPAQQQFRRLCQRWTKPRQQIFRLLMQRRRHPLSAKEIYVLLRPAGHDIGIATIYRTLDLLDKAGLLRKVQCKGGQVKYQCRRADQPDHLCHLICTVCGTVLNYREFKKEDLGRAGRTEEMLARKSGFLIKDYNIEYFGFCKKCRPGGTGILSTASPAGLRPGDSS